MDNTEQPVSPTTTTPLAPTPASAIPSAPAAKNSSSRKKGMIVFGILELIVFVIILRIIIPLLALVQSYNVSSNTLGYIGAGVFGLGLIAAVLQIIIGAFSLEAKTGRKVTKGLFILGIVFLVLSIPMFFQLVMTPIYDLTSQF